MNKTHEAKSHFVLQKARQKTKRIVTESLTKLIFFILLLGFAYIILYPFLFKILASFMSYNDLYDSKVSLVPKHWVIDTYKYIIVSTDFIEGLKNTAIYALLVATCATASATLVGYGLARFKFPGVKIVTALVVFTMMLPIQTISLPLYSAFRFFDIFGIITKISGKGLELTNTVWPMVALGITSLGFRAGIFVILMRQYYINIPNELIEAAYVDGSGTIRTLFKIVLPMAKSMLLVIFSLSFAWEWTDTFYSGLLNGGTNLLPNVVLLLNTTSTGSNEMYLMFIRANTAAIMAIIPLITLYCFLQKKIIQGIERSGIVG